MNSSSSNAFGSAKAAIAAPISNGISNNTPAINVEEATEAKKVLLERLVEAANRIRNEERQLRDQSFSDRSKRLLRLLGEMIDEQTSTLAPGGSK